MNSQRLPASIELDGTVELLRCPDFEVGWSPTEVVTHYSPDKWHLPPSLDHLREEWNRRHPDERNDAKVALREFRLDEAGGLVCRLQQTEWRDVRPLHESPPLHSDVARRRTVEGYEFLLPNIGVVHVIATTNDGWILAMRRSEFVHYHPGSWTLTYEEGLAPEDIEGGAPFQRAARRGLLEELTARAGKVSLNDFRAVSVVLEQPLGNPAVIVIANLPLSRNDLEGHVSSDEFDRNSLTTIPIDETYLEAVMTGAASVFGKRAGRWHPTSRYRLLATIAHFFGEEASARVLSRIPRDRAGRR